MTRPRSLRVTAPARAFPCPNQHALVAALAGRCRRAGRRRRPLAQGRRAPRRVITCLHEHDLEAAARRPPVAGPRRRARRRRRALSSPTGPRRHQSTCTYGHVDLRRGRPGVGRSPPPGRRPSPRRRSRGVSRAGDPRSDAARRTRRRSRPGGRGASATGGRRGRSACVGTRVNPHARGRGTRRGWSAESAALRRHGRKS